MGLDSSVGIATRYGLDGPGIESRWGEIFRTRPDRPWGPPGLQTMAAGSFTRVKHKSTKFIVSHSSPEWGILRLGGQKFLHAVYLTGFIFKIFCTDCIIVLSVLSPNFSHHYPPVFRLSYVGTVNASFFPSRVLCYAVLWPVPLPNSLLRRLAVCNAAELMLWWCILTICISGSSLLSTYSISFAISTT